MRSTPLTTAAVVALLAASSLGAQLLWPQAANAAGECGVSVGLEAADASCDWTYEDYTSASSSGDGHTWVVVIQPHNGGIRADELMCTEEGEQGLWHDVYRDGEDVGDVCVPDSEQTPSIDELAARAFREYSWPSSELSVQPRGNETLVNLDTIFFTANDAPSARTVTLLGRQVEIEATPAYTWVFGDGETATTTSPGHAYPGHDVFHVYATAGPVRARVDTTYRGRFRVGDGPWQDIAETLTVAGEPVDLDVREAQPVLVR